MRVLGQHLIDFWKAWPVGKDVYLDEGPFSEDDAGFLCMVGTDGEPATVIDPTTRYEIDYGQLAWQGKGDAPSDFDDDLVRVLRKWIRGLTTTTFVVQVQKEQAQDFKALCKERSWKVV
jgi:hypothetical protein